MSELYLSQSDFQDIFKNHLKIDVYSKPIESLFSVRSRKKIDYSPYYQRNYVWDENKATYFIESIILGTEIPPLIFFNNGDSIEVIDGRQRFETLARFIDGEITLKRKGLGLLRQLDRLSYKTLPDEVLEVFLTSTLRVIEFEIVNEPKLDPLLQDKVKKEIFSRYNSGITPLKKSEVETAVYIEDEVTKCFQEELEINLSLRESLEALFFRASIGEPTNMKESDALSFIRRLLVQHRVPITYFAQGKKGEVLHRLYEQYCDTVEDPLLLLPSFNAKVCFVSKVAERLRSIGVEHNRSLNECLLWGLFVLENEGAPLDGPSEAFLESACKFYRDNISSFDETDRHFYGPVVRRYNATMDFLESQTGVSLHIYRSATDDSKAQMKDLMRDADSASTLVEMESLRLNKPDPTRLSIEDIHKLMMRRKFLVRPPYQRGEVINLSKATSIIESILLGIALPVIFVYKRSNGISEVIDGQQRLLTILGFIQSEYVDERGESVRTRNHGFKLRNMRILDEYKGLAYHELPQTAQDRIMDFPLFVVTIEERLNPAFDPVDLFIRLNDKPYPIKEHSFEMWNSWVGKDLITTIRSLTSKNRGWLYVRIPTQRNFRDRMENEEAIAILSFLSAKRNPSDLYSDLDIYQKDSRLNVRVKGKRNVTMSLLHASENQSGTQRFLDGIKAAKSLVKKIKLILLDRDISDEGELLTHLESRFNDLCHPGKTTVVRRAFQDYYVLWLALSEISTEMVQLHRENLYGEVQNIFRLFRTVPEEVIDGVQLFQDRIRNLHEKYRVADRRLRLSDAEIADLVSKQGNRCSISGAPIYIGDELHVDHDMPVSKGGADEVANLGIAHSHSNLQKGSSSMPSGRNDDGD